MISGDNPQAVQYIAREAGIAHYDKAIAGPALAALNAKQFAKVCKRDDDFRARNYRSKND